MYMSMLRLTKLEPTERLKFNFGNRPFIPLDKWAVAEAKLQTADVQPEAPAKKKARDTMEEVGSKLVAVGNRFIVMLVSNGLNGLH